MIEKQVDFDVRVYALGNGSDGSWTHDMVSKHIREEYLVKGWKVFSVNTNQVSAGVIYLQVAMVKVEYVSEADLIPVEPTAKTGRKKELVSA